MYNLTSSRKGMMGIYGIEVRQPYNRLEHWKATVDLLAEFGCNTWFFWVAGGIFRSRKFPSSNVYASRKLGRGLPKTSEAEFRRLLKYAGGKGVDIFLETGVFYWDGVQDIILNQFPHLQAQGTKFKGLMCLSKPESLRIMEKYLWEMIARFPESPGIALEAADEVGSCQCPDCKKNHVKIELEFLKKFLGKYWAAYPDKRVVWFTGYDSHREHPDYYEELKKISNNKNFYLYWVRARNCYVDRRSRKHWFRDPATYGDFANNLLDGAIVPGRLHFSEPEFCRLLKEANIKGWIAGIPAGKIGSPYDFSWYSLVPPKWKRKEGIDWFPVHFGMFLYRLAFDRPGFSIRQMIQSIRETYFNGTTPRSICKIMLDLYKFHHAESWWLGRSNLLKDSCWCRSGGKWHFYFGYPEFGNQVPESTRIYPHPAVFVPKWKAEGRVPDEWIGFYLRLEQNRARWLGFLKRNRSVFEKIIRTDDGQCQRTARMVLDYVDWVRRDLLFISRNKAENYLYDGFMKLHLKKIKKQFFDEGRNWPCFENVVPYDVEKVRATAFQV